MEKKGFSGSKLFPVFVFAAIAFLMSLLPLFLIAGYDHPSADDFSYGLQTSQAWAATGSAARVLSAAFQTVRDTYFTWQGSFSGVFMMAVQPAVFGEKLYFLTPLLVLPLFLLGTLFLAKVLLRDCLGADRYGFLIIGFAVAAMSLNFLPSAVEGVYWYNGAVYYTGFYSLSLIVFGFVLRLYLAKSRKAVIGDSVFVVLFSFLLGGSNYTTALVTALVLAVLTAVGFLRGKKLRAAAAAAATFADLAALAVSVAAPGNAVRKSDFANTPTASAAVLRSFKTALVFIGQWTSPPVIVCLIFLLPIVYRTVRASEFSFRFPLLVPLVSFCIFSAQFAPPIYALGNPGPARLLDIVYYSYYLLLLVNLFYLTGWLAKQLRGKDTGAAEESVYRRLCRLAGKYTVPLLLCFTVLFAAACVGSNRFGTITCVSTAESLKSGQAAEYGREADLRSAAYLGSKRKNVVVNKFSVKPYALYFNDIESAPSNWRNLAIAKYYGLKSVIRKK